MPNFKLKINSELPEHSVKRQLVFVSPRPSSTTKQELKLALQTISAP